MRPILVCGVWAAHLFIAGTASAGAIIWGPPKTISGNADVSTVGRLLSALNLQGPTVVINGVTFTAAGLGNISPNFVLPSSGEIFGSDGPFGSTQFPFAGLSTDYKDLLDSGAFTFTGQNPPPPMTLSIISLTIGQLYEFQWWVNDSPDTGDFDRTTTAMSGASVSLEHNLANVEGGVGQFVIGAFLADATTQTIVFQGAGTGPNVGATQINGFQLRVIASGDCDGTGSIDLLDHTEYASCLTGPGVALSSMDCFCIDFDDDNDADLLDFADLQNAFSGKCQGRNRLCDDGNACTSGDVCVGGACAGASIPNCPGQGGGGGDGVLDGDGDAVTDAQDVCSATPRGQPVNADGCSCSQIDCDDGDICTTDACADGACSHTNNTRPCNDGDACTVGDRCSNGICAGRPRNCDDDNACTSDTCVDGVCVHPPFGCPKDLQCDPRNGKCVVCLSDADCDDALFCNGFEHCEDGSCRAGEPPCNSNNDSCNEDTDECEPDSDGDGVPDVRDECAATPPESVVENDGCRYFGWMITDSATGSPLGRSLEPIREGDVVLIEAPATPRGQVFDHWDGDVPAGRESQNPLSLIIDSDKDISPVYEAVISNSTMCGAGCGCTPGAPAVILTFFGLLAMRFVGSRRDRIPLR